MDRSEAQRIHDSMSSELDEVRTELTKLQRREAALVKLVEGVEELFPGLVGSEDSGIRPSDYAKARTPRGKEAIERVLAEDPLRYMTVTEIVEAQAARGWADAGSRKAADAVRTTLGRMRKAGEVDRRKRGNSYAYRLKNKLDATESDTEASSLLLSRERTDHETALAN